MSTRNVTTRKWLPAQRSAQVVLRKRGFTVLEVLVAMFILLVGGLAILNIFPPALRVIRGSENREIAISMSQSKLETYANEPETIPYAIYNGDDATGAFFDANVAVAGTRIRNFSLPRENTQAAFEASALSNLNNAGFRRIVGERHRVLANPGNSLSVILNHAYAGVPNFFVEENIVGVKTSNFGVLDFTDARLESDETITLSDTTNPATLSTSTTPRNWRNSTLQYYVSYRYLEGTNVAGVEDERIDLSTSTTNRLFQNRGSITQPITQPIVVAGEIAMRVRIPLRIVSAATVVAFPQTGYVNLPSSSAAAFTCNDEIGRPIVANSFLSIDYTVSDWRSLVLDFDTSTPTSKTLPLIAGTDFRDIKLPVSVLSNQPLYAMLFNKTTTGLTPQSGAIGQWSTTPAPPVFDVNNLSATIGVVSGTNPQARISYQTSRGWAQQISVAAKTYYRFDLARGAAEQERWREYWSSGSSLYFHPSEAGKTVLVTFRNGTTTITNQVTPIGRDLQPAPADPLFVGFLAAPVNRVAVATLTNASGVSITPSAILSVHGASIRARTAWIENNNYVQEIKEDYRPLTD